MTHDILQSDVDLARRLLRARCPDKEIVSALIKRGIDAQEAAQLLDDLQKGRTVKARVELGALRAQQPSSDPVDQPSYVQQPVQDIAPSGSRRWVWLFVIIVVVLVGVLALAVVRYQILKSHSEKRLEAAEQTRLRTLARLESGTKAGTSAPFRSKTIVELSSSGLSVEGCPLAATNALAVLQKVFGSPSRTNWVASSSTVLYAFDRQGILLFTPRDLQPSGLLLDFEGEGGEYGTQAPFSGVLRIGTQEIHAQTPASILRSNPELTLTNAPSEGRILAGHCNGFETICSFLKTADRLSSVEIRLAK